MAQGQIISEFSRNYNSMSGADIKAVFHGKIFGELQAISYAITREKAPIYTMGSPDPRSYSRNKRGIAGSFVWINYDENSLLKHFNDTLFQADIEDIRPDWADPNGSNLDVTQQFLLSTANLNRRSLGETNWEFGTNGDQRAATPWYADQVPPFDVVLVANNEYGASAKMRIIGVEILNDGLGVSIDDTVIESQSTFVARTILPFQSVKNPFRDQYSGNITTPSVPGT
jgi:hypothetical protein